MIQRASNCFCPICHYLFHCILRIPISGPLFFINPQPRWFKHKNIDAKQWHIPAMGEWKTSFLPQPRRGVSAVDIMHVAKTSFYKQAQFSELTHMLGSSAAWMIQNRSSLCLWSNWSVFLYYRTGCEGTNCLFFHWEWSWPLFSFTYLADKRCNMLKQPLPHQIKGLSSLVSDDTSHQMPGEEWMCSRRK